MDDTAQAPNGERAMARMRRYTTVSLFAVALAYIAVGVIQAESRWLQVVIAVVGVLVSVHTAWWERRPPLWLSIPAVASSGALWCLALTTREAPVAALIFSMALSLHVYFDRRRRLVTTAIALALLFAPLVVVVIMRPAENWVPWFTIAVVSFAGSLALFFLNGYGWRLYTDLDEARRASAQLAVAQERYRFAADLHDIQGHTLHVIRLKTQLANRLIDRDPAAARAQLVEAEQLIVETLANTKSLAFGNRHVALTSELANARELFLAAGIDWSVTGDPTAGPNDELFGLVVRETTTNILRHAQSTRVAVTIDPRRLTITNDGSPELSRAPSGLARLGERFDKVGGSLRTSVAEGVFTTEASIR